MAHARDARRLAYWNAAQKHLGSALADVTEGLDQFVYDPRAVCYTLPATRALEDPTVELERVRKFLNQAGNNDRLEQPIEKWPGLDCYVIPVEGADSRELVRFVNTNDFTDDVSFSGQIAPLSYMLSQQVVQPGEDPEGPPPGAATMLGTVSDPTLGHGVTVHIIDTGIDSGAVGIVGQAGGGGSIEKLDDPTEPLTDPPLLGPAAGHGTFVASLIRSIAPGAELLSYRTTESSLGLVSEQKLADVIAEVVAAINADETSAHVVNLSLGGYPAFAKDADLKDPNNDKAIGLGAFLLLKAAMATIPDHVAVVGAAGNCGSLDPFYPAAFDDVVGVAALDPAGALWDESNAGTWVDACARGVDLAGRFVRGRENVKYEQEGTDAEEWLDEENYASWSGTSFAAPLVSGQIAVLAGQLQVSARQAADLLLATSKAHPSAAPRICGKRILVDLPGQT